MRGQSSLFWRENPALLLGLSLTLGAGCFLFWQSPWNYLFAILWSCYLIYLRKASFIAALALSFFYSWILYGKAPILDGAIPTKAIFSIDSVQPHHSPFQKGLVYKGTIYLKTGAFPCSVYHHSKKGPEANCDYLLEGNLKQRAPYDYLFSPKKWEPIKKNWGLAQIRYQTKELLRKFLKKKLTPKASTFLASLLTGDVEDRQLRYDFGKLGLQHILAVSGFHFGILIVFFSFLLQALLPRFWKYIMLILMINAYFLFIGELPAVQRSWMTAQLYLIAKLFKRQTTALNLLGCAMALEICLNPLICGNIGFHLSFLSCGGILLLHPFFEKYLRAYLPKRSPDAMRALNFRSKHGYLLTSFLRQTMSLTLAVHCAIWPLLLYHFHQLPLLGIFYNLFAPLFVGGALFLLLMALSVHVLSPPLAAPLFTLTNWGTTHFLDLISYPPSRIDFSLFVPYFPSWCIPFYLFTLFSCCILFPKENEYIAVPLES